MAACSVAVKTCPVEGRGRGLFAVCAIEERSIVVRDTALASVGTTLDGAGPLRCAHCCRYLRPLRTQLALMSTPTRARPRCKAALEQFEA